MFNFLLHHLLVHLSTCPHHHSFIFNFLIVSAKSAGDDKWNRIASYKKTLLSSFIYPMFHCPGCSSLHYSCFLILLVFISKLWVCFCSFLKSTLTLYATFVQFFCHAAPSYECFNHMNLTSPSWKLSSLVSLHIEVLL